MKMESKILPEYDVIIVGAGPSGCIAAKYLSEHYNVLLLDQMKMPRDKPCGGILVEETRNFLEKNLPTMPKSVFCSPKKLDMKNIDWNNNIELNMKRGLYNINRIQFDRWIFELCKKNIFFSHQTRCAELKKGKDLVRIVIKKFNKEITIKSKYLIGADGAFSVVRKLLGENRQIRQYIAIQEFIKSKNGFGNKFLFIYDNNLTDFYSWVIPKNDNIIIGTALPQKNANEKFQFFKKKLKEKLGITGGVSKKEGWLINRPEFKNDVFLGNDKALLIGEAAGLISPSTAEGISFALRSGFNCARAIIENPKNPLEAYKKISLPLIDEISAKLKKSEILSNPIKRKRYFLKM